MGVAGSGKTTLAKEILRRVPAVYLDNNHIADAFFPETRNGRKYDQVRPRFYRALYLITEANLRVGNSVLLDVPHVKEMRTAQWRRFIRRMAARANATIIVLRCFCSEETLRLRLASRNEKRDRWKLAHWRGFLAEQPIQMPLSFDHLSIDTENDLSTNVKTAVRYILNSSQILSN
jgi:predicted kinase